MHVLDVCLIITDLPSSEAANTPSKSDLVKFILCEYCLSVFVGFIKMTENSLI